MNDFLILDTHALMHLCDDGTQALDALLASGQRIFVSETALAELMAQAEAVLPRIASLWACTWVLENLRGLEYAGVAAIFSCEPAVLLGALKAGMR